MTVYKCRECTGRSGELLSFIVLENGEEYDYKPKHCPVCGQTRYIETV
jgi:rubrerythrin